MYYAWLFTLNTVILFVFQIWLSSIIDSYKIDMLPLCLLAGCPLIAQSQQRQRSVTVYRSLFWHNSLVGTKMSFQGYIFIILIFVMCLCGSIITLPK